MLQTVEAEVDVKGNVRLLEPLTLDKPTRALVTLLEEPANPGAGNGNAGEILAFLRSHRLPEESRPSAEEIEAQIASERNSWQ